jgi:hypothetical protein
MYTVLPSGSRIERGTARLQAAVSVLAPHSVEGGAHRLILGLGRRLSDSWTASSTRLLAPTPIRRTGRRSASRIFDSKASAAP